MKILVIGGMHGNEPLGPAIVQLFSQKPIAGVGTLLANKPALRDNVRFVKTDLNRAFPGSIQSDDYESRRASEVLKVCKDYDLVIDFHNTYCPDNDCAFIGVGADQLLYSASLYFGLSRIIVADYDCLNKYAPNCISVEVSLQSNRMKPEDWYEAISKLTTNTNVLPKTNMAQTELYKFVYRLTLEDREQYKLRERRLQAFKPLDAALSKKLGVKYPAYPIFIDDAYTPYNFGGLLNKINNNNV